MKHLVVTGGGTAGHVLPHVAVARTKSTPLGLAVASGDVQVHYVGSHDGMERGLITRLAPEWDYVPVSAGKLRRYLSWRNLLSPFQVAAGFWQARRALRRIGADAVFSKGGFVAAPVVWAAASLGIPVAIHESDRSPALATRLTARYADSIFVAFEATVEGFAPRYRSKVEVVGIPLREELFTVSTDAARKHFALDGQRPTLLVFGGSLGAAALNDVVKSALDRLVERCNVIHIVGRGKGFAVPIRSDRYRQYEYLDADMSLALAAADVALCRAGASSIFELAALRKPMLLVPLPLSQSRGDQIENARYFAQRGWADVLPQEGLTADVLLDAFDELWANHADRVKALESAPSTRAVERVGERLLELMERRAR